jgi:dTDP-4-amino-4,6-dideoxygalactose transaminase
MTPKKLAIDGGKPIRTKPFASWPYFEPDEIDAAASVLRSGQVNYWTGEEGTLFEKEFASFCGSKYAVALANGTAALEAALAALDIGTGDEVIVPCRTFIASASAVVIRGARPIFADVDAASQNITSETIKPLLTPRTRALIAVHIAGWPCDMDSILDLAREHNLKLIEDCAQAHGAVYKGRRAGSFGDVAAFSFCQDKIMTTGGEGGLVTTNNKKLWQKTWAYKDHGKDFATVFNRRHPIGFRWVHKSIGTNWRMTEFQAAIGRIVLRKLPAWIRVRQRNARVLNDCFRTISALEVKEPPPHITHAYYKYNAFVNKARLKKGWSRDRIMEAINAEGIPCFYGICSEVYREKAFVSLGLGPSKRLPTAKRLGETSLTFLVHPTLTARDMRDTCRAVEKVFAAASR